MSPLHNRIIRTARTRGDCTSQRVSLHLDCTFPHVKCIFGAPHHIRENCVAPPWQGEKMNIYAVPHKTEHVFNRKLYRIDFTHQNKLHVSIMGKTWNIYIFIKKVSRGAENWYVAEIFVDFEVCCATRCIKYNKAIMREISGVRCAARHTKDESRCAPEQQLCRWLHMRPAYVIYFARRCRPPPIAPLWISKNRKARERQRIERRKEDAELYNKIKEAV